MFQQYSFKNVILLLEASESFGLSTILNIINRPAGINIWPLMLVKDTENYHREHDAGLEYVCFPFS